MRTLTNVSATDMGSAGIALNSISSIGIISRGGDGGGSGGGSTGAGPGDDLVSTTPAWRFISICLEASSSLTLASANSLLSFFVARVPSIFVKKLSSSCMKGSRRARLLIPWDQRRNHIKRERERETGSSRGERRYSHAQFFITHTYRTWIVPIRCSNLNTPKEAEEDP